MPMVVTLTSTRLENLYQNLIASKNSLKISLSQVLRIGQNCVLKFKQMVFTTKTALLSHQMVLSATSMTYLLLSTQLHNGLKNAKRRKSVRSTTLQQVCQQKPSPYYTSAYDMDMRKVIDVYAAATEHVDQGLSLTPLYA